VDRQSSIEAPLRSGSSYEGLSTTLKHWSGPQQEWNGEELPLPPAIVVRLESVKPHPNADRLDVLRFAIPIDYGKYGCYFATLVAGKHYKRWTEGVWFTPGSVLPGYMSDEMWSGPKVFEVRAFPVRGVMSQGLFAGSVWRKTPEHPFEPWRFWKSSWKPGADVSDYFGITRPHSSVAEQPTSSRQVTDASSEGASLGSIPVAGSTLPVLAELKTAAALYRREHPVGAIGLAGYRDKERRAVSKRLSSAIFAADQELGLR
jgi:hypothetical protein